MKNDHQDILNINEQNKNEFNSNKEENIDLDDFLIDSHLHLQYFTDEEISFIIKKCFLDSNIRYFLSNSTCSNDFARTINFSELKSSDFINCQNKENIIAQIIFPGIGHHPWYLENIENDWSDNLEKKIIELEKKNCNFFIGEIGIDGGRPKKKVALDKQIDIFLKQFDLAEKYNKLVTIHCVYEWEKLYKAIENNKNKENLVQESKIILHSFQGNCKIMEKFKNFNPWFSISPGCFIEKNFDMIRKIPIENLLLESDSPSMFNNLIYDDENKFSFYFKEENGKFKNHPMSIIDLGSKIAELKEIPIKYFFEQIQKNSKRILKMIKIH